MSITKKSSQYRPTIEGKKKKGVGKAVRRTLPSADTSAHDEVLEKKAHISKQNWESFRSAGKQAIVLAPAPASGDELHCKHFSNCSGCSIDRSFEAAPITSEAASFCDTQMALASRSMFGVKGETDAPKYKIYIGSPFEWRTHAKLAVSPAGKYGGVILGLYKAGSHEVLQIPNCRVHHPSINEAMDVLMKATGKTRILAYREEQMEGMLRYVQMSVERSTGKIQLTLVWNTEDYRAATPHLQLLVKEMKKQAPELFHSIWANFRMGPGNTIFSRKPHSWHRCLGPEFVKETIVDGGIPFSFSPLLFRQANLDQFGKIVLEVEKWVPEGSVVCELYAGVGIIGLSIVHKVKEVRCSDVNIANVRAFERTREKLLPQLSRRASYKALSAEDALDAGEADDATCIIVDPPRKGLDAAVLASFRDRSNSNTGAARRLIYISCGFDAFKIDSVSLADGGWKLIHSEGHILFPGSDHIETVAIFDR